MFVVTEEVSIALENVTEIFSICETSLWLSVGEIDSTVGAVVSEVVVVLSVVVVSEVDSSFSPQEKRIKLKIMERIMRIYLKELPVRVLGIHRP